MEKLITIPYKLYEQLNNDEEKPKESKINAAIILNDIPKKFLNKAKTLLSYIGNTIDWDDLGQVIIDGRVIEHSHISDLVRYALCPFGKSPPKGLNDFQKKLQELNIPQGLIQHSLFGKSPELKQTRKSSIWESL